jgi:hypothetical protein
VCASRHYDEAGAIAVAWSETLFVILPLIVVTLVELTSGKSVWQLAASPEWSFGAAVFLGQSIIKTVHGMSHLRAAANTERISLFLSIVVVLALVPTLVTLALILTSNSASTPLVVAQLVLFVVALFVFVLSSYGEYSERTAHVLSRRSSATPNQPLQPSSGA